MSDAREKKCVFCEIVAGRAPAYIIEQDELSMCILDIHPYTKGHCLVISKRHVPWWHDLSDEENASLFRLAKKMANRMMERFSRFRLPLCPGAGGFSHPSVPDSDL